MRTRTTTKHTWRVLGGATGWVVCRCQICGTNEIPMVTGLMWSDVSRFVIKKNRCQPRPLP